MLSIEIHPIKLKGENGHLLIKRTLFVFWNLFGGRKNSGRGYRSEEKLAAVKRMSEVVIPFHTQNTLRFRRDGFDDAKSKLHKFSRFGDCFVCGRPAATDRHHLIQLQNGGTNCKNNLISLCSYCHAEIHPWMKQHNN